MIEKREFPFHNMYNPPNIHHPVLSQWLKECFSTYKNSSITIICCREDQKYILIEAIQEIKPELIRRGDKFYNKNQKIQLLNALGQVIVEDQKQVKKLVQLSGLKKLQLYCKQHERNLKNFFKAILIEKYDQTKKIIKYRNSSAVQQILRNLTEFVENSLEPGEIQINKSAVDYAEQVKRIAEMLLQIKESSERKIYFCQNSQNINYSVNNITLPLVLFFNSIQKKCYLVKLRKLSKSFEIMKTLMKMVKNQILALKIIHIKTIEKYIIDSKVLREKQKTSQVAKIVEPKIKMFLEMLNFNKNQSKSNLVFYLESFQQRIIYIKKKKQRNINLIQSALLRYLKASQYQKQLTQQFIKREKQIYLRNQNEYKKVVHSINTLLMKTGGYIGYGVDCQITIIGIENWVNCEHFFPQNLLEFFQKVLQKKNCSLVKISIKDGQLQLILGNGSVRRIGCINRSSASIQQGKENTFIKFVQNDENDCIFGLNSHGYLYAKGNNIAGQLGVGIEGTITEFFRVKISEKVNFLSSGGQKTVCITSSNEIYLWGVFRDEKTDKTQIRSLPQKVKKPKWLQNKKIIGASCTYTTVYIQTQNGELFNLHKGLIKTFKNSVDERILLTTGNKNLQITYVLSINVTCYDRKKKKSILGWFRNLNNGKFEQNNEEILLERNDQNQNYNTQTTNDSGKSQLLI